MAVTEAPIGAPSLARASWARFSAPRPEFRIETEPWLGVISLVFAFIDLLCSCRAIIS
jgi:hypothetical protein